MSSEADGRYQGTLNWLLLILLLGFAVCIFLLPRSMASATDTVSFLERLATRAERISLLPPETRTAISTVLTDHNLRNQKFKDQALEARRLTALRRIEAALSKHTTIATSK